MLGLLFGSLHSSMKVIEAAAKLARRKAAANASMPAEILETIDKNLRGLQRECESFEFHQSVHAINRTIEKIVPETSAEVLAVLLDRVWETIYDEGAEHCVFHVQPKKATFLLAAPHPWAVVITKFYEAEEDVSSALTCYAVNENTACVFHLMRVLEHGLAALAAEVGKTFNRQNWHNIIEEIELGIKDIRNGPKSAQKDDRLKFLSEAAKEFFYFKAGWRNYVSHNRGRYDENQALSTIEHVRAFMTVLSTNLA
ncbi:MAG: hypothetical protein QOC72_4 [Methylobacteriaceae bacterium]|jgi:hypothetical protein|nr:hypothetical protein [Methylobacteriaceae bacterium]